MAKPIPDGFRTVTPYLRIRGVTDAIAFYKKAFGAEEIMSMPGPGGAIMHAEIKIGDSILMMTDENPQWGCLGPQTLNGTSVGIHLYVTDCDAWMKKAEAAGAKITMPAMDMFWGDRFGQVTDPFGHVWSIATHKEDLSPEEIGKRGEEAMKHMCSDAAKQ